MIDQQLYDLYVEHIWLKSPEVYRDELTQCERIILAGIKTILDIANPKRCICGGEPHVSHCPANSDPFLKGFV